MKKLSAFMLIFTATLLLQGCITKVVTVPVKAAYTVTKGVVKGTAKVVESVIPGKDDDDKKD